MVTQYYHWTKAIFRHSNSFFGLCLGLQATAQKNLQLIDFISLLYILIIIFKKDYNQLTLFAFESFLIVSVVGSWNRLLISQSGILKQVK